jgi:pentalenene oxygenase
MKPFSSIPAAPGALPILGHVLPLLRDPIAWLTAVSGHGPLVRVGVGPTQAVMVCDPDLTWQILHDDRLFDKGGPFFDRARDVIGNSVVSCPHRDHRRQRRLIQPAFRTARIPGYAQAMLAHSAAAAESWSDGQLLDVRGEMNNITASIAVETMFSATLPTQLITDFRKDFTTALGGVYLQMIMPALFRKLPTPGNRRFRAANARLRTTLDPLIAARRAEGTDHGDLLSALVSATVPDDSQEPGLSDSEISDQVVVFFIAGSETAANALTWILYLLACHPDIEKRFHAEIDQVLTDGIVGIDDIPQLTFTRNIVTEVLRLYPPGWLFTRMATADTELGGHAIPAGTALVLSAYLMHHQPESFEDPERFDPDRWDSRHRPQPPREAFIPFGAGPRHCIGDHFGITTVTLTLATLATRWRFQAVDSQPVRPVLSATLRPAKFKLRAITRTPRQSRSARTQHSLV